MSDFDGTPEEKQWLLDVLSPVRRLHEDANALVLMHPEPASPAVLDARVPFGACALMYATQATQVAIDHLLTTLQTVPFDERIPALLLIGVVALSWGGISASREVDRAIEAKPVTPPEAST